MFQDRDNMRKAGVGTERKERASHLSREIRKKRSKLMERLIVCASILAAAALIIFGIVRAFIFIGGLMDEDFQFSYTACEGWSECDSISAVDEDYAIGIQYPLINDKTDGTVKKHAKAMLKSFKKEIKRYEHGNGEDRAVYTASYSIVKNSDIYVSLLYTVHRYNPARELDDIRYIAKIYDISTGKEVSARKIFNVRYPALVSGYVTSILKADARYAHETGTKLFIENTKPDIDNFSNIGFSEDTLTVYFSAGDIFPSDIGELKVDVPLSRVHESMLLNITDYSAPVYDPDKPMIALTFDDGPLKATTSKILDTLESVGGRATFFIIGNRVNAQKEMIIRGDSLGCEYGNHSWSHTDLSVLSEAEMLEQLKKTDDALYSVIGKKCALTRAPYAAISDAMIKAADTPFIGWSVDTRDWETRNAASIKEKILGNVSDGDFIVMHDIYTATAAAMEEIIPQLAAQGFQLVTVSELMEARGIPLTPGKVYRSAPR